MTVNNPLGTSGTQYVVTMPVPPATPSRATTITALSASRLEKPERSQSSVTILPATFQTGELKQDRSYFDQQRMLTHGLLYSYDALENIINQCFSDQSASFDPSSSPNGRWTIGDEWYWITMDYEEPAPSGDEVDVDDGRSDTSGYA